jgi:hypothetical protein
VRACLDDLVTALYVVVDELLGPDRKDEPARLGRNRSASATPASRSWKGDAAVTDATASDVGHPPPRRSFPRPRPGQVVRPAARGRELPLSFAQERLWFLDQLMPGSAAYNLAAAFRIRGRLEVSGLRRALNEVVRRHEALRTVFASVQGRPIQVVTPALEVPMAVVDLSGGPVPDREAELGRLLAEEAGRSFDLAAGPLIRALLVRLDDQDHGLSITMHHIVADGWSMGILFQELAGLYQAFTAGQPSPLGEPALQYADYALWQRQWLTSQPMQGQLGHWKRQLAGVQVLELPTDRPRPPIQSFQGAEQALVIPGPLRQALAALSRQEGATLFMGLLAGLAVLLGRYSGQDDIAVGSPIANRTRRELEGLIGFFVNTLVLRVDLTGDPSFRGLLGRVREVATDAYDHQDLPFEKLVEELNPTRNLSHNPLFQVMLSLQSGLAGTLRLPGLQVEHLRAGKDTAKFDLTISLRETDSGLDGHVEYSTDLFEGATVARLVGHWQRLLEQAVADPDQPISSLELLTEPEHHQLARWNTTTSPIPDRCVHELIADQADQHPDAVAVSLQDHQLTYRQLDQQANQLAWHLASLGVGPEVLVGICLPRSLDLIVGLLGILKAGGAYVPLDPDYPSQRLAYMVHDARLGVLVTHQQLLGRLPSPAAAVVCLDRDQPPLAGGPPPPPPPHPRPPPPPPSSHRGPGQHRLCHLHLRLHRPPQRRRHPPPQPDQLPDLDGHRPRPVRRRRRPGHHLPVVRHRRPGAVPAPAVWRPDRPGPRPPRPGPGPAARPPPAGRSDPAPGHPLHPAAAGGSGLGPRRPPAGAVRR